MNSVTKTILFLLIYLPNLVLGQLSNVINYNTTNGLESNYIYQIDQDSTGFLWLASGEGLLKMDEKKIIFYLF